MDPEQSQPEEQQQQDQQQEQKVEEQQQEEQQTQQITQQEQEISKEFDNENNTEQKTQSISIDSQPQQQQEQQQAPIKHQSLQEEIVVYVIDPIVKDSVKNFVVYTVKGQDRDGPFEVVRRFSDFHNLKQFLTSRWPGCYVPPTPEKKTVGNFDHKFVEERRKQLQYFMQKLAELPHLWYGEEVQLFLRTNTSDVEAALTSLPKVTFDVLIRKYENSFSHLSGKEINTDVIIKISSFTNFIRKMVPILENYKDICKSMIGARKQHNQNLDIFTSFMLPEYEKTSLTEYLDQDTENKLVFTEPEAEQLHDIQIRLKEFVHDTEMEDLLEMIKSELKELAAFQETMNVRGSYETLKGKSLKKKQDLNEELSGLMSNKTTLKGLFSSKNKAQQIESVQKKLELEDQNIANLTLICEIMTVILGYVEIDRFKNEKEQKYYNTIRTIAKHELSYQKQQVELWNQVLENKNLL